MLGGRLKTPTTLKEARKMARDICPGVKLTTKGDDKFKKMKFLRDQICALYCERERRSISD